MGVDVNNSVNKCGRLAVFFLIVVVVGEIFFGWSPEADRTTWFLENAPVFLLLPLAIYLQPRWQLSTLLLAVLTLHALVLMLGGHYSYTEVPFGYWLKETFHFSRNPYDRIGHFFQGFTPALVYAEILPKKTALRAGVFQTIVILSMCLAFSALYELIEWAAAVALGQGADAFLGTQGDPWDTQWDMFMALIGAITALLLSRLTKKS
jgi:putative membrane protein